MGPVSQDLEADVALIHIAGGATRTTPPPGTLAQIAPRRAARGRGSDLLFLSLTVQPKAVAPPGMPGHLAQSAAEAYYDTPGTVTAALREAAAEVNQRLLDANQDSADPSQFTGRMILGVLRGDDLYIGQCGDGQAVVIRGGQASALTSEEAASRPLGTKAAPHVRFHHLQLEPEDRVLLTTVSGPLWSEPTLSAVSGLSVTEAVERLGAASRRDVTGVFIRSVPRGEAALPVKESVGRRRPARAKPQAEPRAVERRRPLRDGALGRIFQALPRLLSPVVEALRRGLRALAYGTSRLLLRLAPGLIEPPYPGAFPPGVLAATAIAVPLIVVAITSVVYFRRGRGAQFEAALAEAQVAAAAAQSETDPFESRQLWESALNSLTGAEAYGRSAEADSLKDQARAAIDAIDLVARLDFRPLISGGFGRDAHIEALAASSTDLYVLDDANEIIYRAWSTGRGYEIDRAFECLTTGSETPEMGMPIDLAIQPEPGALGAEGVVAIDADGTLLYCAPEKSPASGQLAEPDLGWGRIQAIDVFGGRLFILDPIVNAVWIYDASGGVFSGNPILFFAEEVPDLETAVDLAMAQDELLILHSDGMLDRCRRNIETTPDGAVRIRTECDEGVSFEDERPGYVGQDHLPGALPTRIEYSPPPEPSLYFLDVLGSGLHLYSMRMVYQGQFKPEQPFPQDLSALALGPPNDLFVAAGDQVYFARATR